MSLLAYSFIGKGLRPRTDDDGRSSAAAVGIGYIGHPGRCQMQRFRNVSGPAHTVAAHRPALGAALFFHDADTGCATHFQRPLVPSDDREAVRRAERLGVVSR